MATPFLSKPIKNGHHDLVIPEWMEFNVGDSMVGDSGRTRVRAVIWPYVHKVGTSKGTYTRMPFFQEYNIDNNAEISVQSIIDNFVKGFDKILDKGEYTEWDLDEFGEEIPGTDKIKKFNRWLFMDNDGKVIKKSKGVK